MKNFYALFFALLGTSGLCQAQTPAQNLMPDGSRDLYMGLGVIVRPNYEGSNKHKVRALPVLQMQWSNGAFIAGMNAGWHLSEQPQYDFGPLLSVEPGRTTSGSGNIIDNPNNVHTSDGEIFPETDVKKNTASKLNTVKTRLTAGAFYHLQLGPQLRLHNQILYGSGNDRNGLRFNSDLRFKLPELFSHQAITIGIGLQAVNQAYARSYFGANGIDNNLQSISLFDDIAFAKSTEVEAKTSVPVYRPRAGIKDVHVDVFWNVNLSSSWLITTKLNATYLLNSAANSPVVQQRRNISVSTALAYRF